MEKASGTSKFQLQPPPRRKKEKRGGCLFVDSHSSTLSVLIAESRTSLPKIEDGISDQRKSSTGNFGFPVRFPEPENDFDFMTPKKEDTFSEKVQENGCTFVLCETSPRVCDDKTSRTSLRMINQNEGFSTAHTVLCFSPVSPITPRRRTGVLNLTGMEREDTTVLLSPCTTSETHEIEPLSATLKRIGAARRNEQFSDCSNDLDSIASSGSLLNHIKNGKSKQESTSSVHDGEMELQASDLGPAPSPAAIRRDVQSTIRGGQQSAMWIGMHHMSTNLASYIFGSDRKAHITSADSSFRDRVVEEKWVASQLPQNTSSDGWGGARPRTSWFPNFHIGPLASPQRIDASCRRDNSSYLLKTSQVKPNDDREMWVDDIPYDYECGADDKNAFHSCDQIEKLRVHFPSHLPQPSSNKPDAIDRTTVTHTSNSAEGRPFTSKSIIIRNRKAVLITVIFVGFAFIICLMVYLLKLRILKPL